MCNCADRQIQEMFRSCRTGFFDCRRRGLACSPPGCNNTFFLNGGAFLSQPGRGMHEEEEGGLTVAGVDIVIKLGLGLGLEERAPRKEERGRRKKGGKRAREGGSRDTSTQGCQEGERKEQERKSSFP